MSTRSSGIWRNVDKPDILTGKKKAGKVVVVDLGKKKGSFDVHKGKLHRALGIPEGEKIPEARLQEALNSKDPEIQRMARSAKGLESMKK